MDRTHRSVIVSLTLLSLVTAACGVAATSAPTIAPTPTTGEMQVMATGELVDIDGTASGTAKLVVEADGSYSLVLEGFEIGSAAHTNVLLVADAVHMTDEVDPAVALDLGPLTGTSGMQSYAVPEAMAANVMDGYHAVVIWDTEMTHAIAAAELR